MTYKCTFYQMDTNGSTFFLSCQLRCNKRYLYRYFYKCQFSIIKKKDIKRAFFFMFFFSQEIFLTQKRIIFRKHHISLFKISFFFYYQLNEIMISRKFFLFSDLVVSHVGETCYLSPYSLQREKGMTKFVLK